MITYLQEQPAPVQMNPFLAAPGMRPGMPPAQMSAQTAGMGNTATPAKPQENYIVWVYNYHHTSVKSTGNWKMYVFFNQRGQVVCLVVKAEDPNVQTGVHTAGGVNIGTSLLDIVNKRKYDWPEPFTTVGSFYYCEYPSQNVTYGLDQRTRQVVSMSIGLPLVVTESVTNGATNAPLQPGAVTPGPRYPR